MDNLDDSFAEDFDSTGRSQGLKPIKGVAIVAFVLFTVENHSAVNYVCNSSKEIVEKWYFRKKLKKGY